jgi:hypothetical protein
MDSYIRTAMACLVCMAAAGPVCAADKLSTIFQFEMLNAQVAYLEAITGPAMHVYAGGGVQIRDYRVAGCRVTVYANGPAVVGYSLDLTPRCNFDLGAFLGNGYSSTSGLTIGKFAAGLFGPQLLVQSSCIYLCGNAADPTVDFTFEGPHAVGFVNVVLTVILADETSIAATERWEAFMRKREGEDYVVNTRFNCDQKYSAEALRDFSKVSVSRVTVGSSGFEPNASSYKAGCSK